MATKADVEMEGGLGVVEHTFAQIRLVSIENNPNCIGLFNRLAGSIVP
jgi:hypothetical protein